MDEEEKLREGLDTRLPDAIRVKEAIGAMMATRGWEYLTDQLNTQIENRKASILLPLESVDQTYEREYSKGEIIGIMMAVHFPQQMLNDAATVIQLYRSAEETEGDYEDGEDFT